MLEKLPQNKPEESRREQIKINNKKIKDKTEK